MEEEVDAHEEDAVRSRLRTRRQKPNEPYYKPHHHTERLTATVDAQGKDEADGAEKGDPHVSRARMQQGGRTTPQLVAQRHNNRDTGSNKQHAPCHPSS